ncbi:hypothetical protein C8Q75DRAFT_471356 [Abortiporus biennis]|nr:hypothetical protein C8Q75DRAFT_471356 [Abortiporus biennis]
MAQSIVPLELRDMIIDHLHEDKESLHSCALVHSSWLDSSRHHLFYDFKLKIQSGPPLHSFLRFIEETPQAALHISRLTIEGDPSAALCPSDEGNITSTQIDFLLDHLPRIHTLRLMQVFVTLPTSSILEQPEDMISRKQYSLRELVFFRILGEACVWEGVLGILSLLHTIDKLTIGFGSTQLLRTGSQLDEQNELLLAKYFPRPVIIRNLCLRYAPLLIPKLVAPGVLEMLDIQYGFPFLENPIIPSISTLVFESRASLQHFEYTIPPSFVTDQANFMKLLQHGVHLSYCSHLTSVHLSFSVTPGFETANFRLTPYLGVIPTTIEKLPICIQHLVFHFLASSNVQQILSDHFDFERVETASLRLPALLTVTFDFISTPNEDAHCYFERTFTVRECGVV